MDRNKASQAMQGEKLSQSGQVAFPLIHRDNCPLSTYKYHVLRLNSHVSCSEGGFQPCVLPPSVHIVFSLPAVDRGCFLSNHSKNDCCLARSFQNRSQTKYVMHAFHWDLFSLEVWPHHYHGKRGSWPWRQRHSVQGFGSVESWSTDSNLPEGWGSLEAETKPLAPKNAW